uniref:Uncharacterized protein n=1 Tax=Roseihalotalea indica TaxID=2867963 RepID=A0AA49GQ49_9BACT|nr:hypothetical protein K4G66_04215 [Tunicatimonas sp. TK19036]
MKKVLYSFLWLFTVGGFLFLTSCGEDGEDPLPITNPTLSGFQVGGVDTTGVTAEPGDAITVNVAYDLDGATGVSLIAYIGDSAVISSLPLSATSANPIQTNFTVPEDAMEDFTVVYELQDADSTTIDSENFDVTVDIAVDATVYEAVLLAAPIGQAPGERTSETFFSATDGETYSVEQVVAGTDVASADIHFGYYYGNTGLASIASPAEYPENVYNLGPNGANWGTLNETLFRPVASLTEEAFDDITRSDVVASQFETAGSADETGRINELAVGAIYAFSFSEGDETRFGIFRVDDIEPGFESNDYISLTVKVAVDE